MLIPSHIQKYAEQYTTAAAELLYKIEQYTHQHHAQAEMLSGHLQGQFLRMISCMIQPKRILEIGTFMGYSALCLAAGLAPRGYLHTIELRENDAATAQKFFDQSSLKDKIILHVGDAQKIIPTLNEKWDLVFIDADKINYINYYELAITRLSEKGFIIADNVLFHGEVFKTPIKGKNALAIQAFNKHVFKDKRVCTVMLTLRDGLMLIHKK